MKWFSNLKVAYRVLLSCLVLILIIAAIAFQGIRSIRVMNADFREFYDDRFMPVSQLTDIMRDLLQIRINMFMKHDAAMKEDWAAVEQRDQDTAKLAEDYQQKWKDYNSTSITVEEKKLMDEWVELAKYPSATRKLYAEAIKSRDFKTSDILLAKWATEYAALRDQTDKLLLLQKTEAQKLEASAQETADNVVLLSFLFLGAGILVGIFITIVLARSISAPVAKGLAFAQRLAEGNFTERIDLDQKDELGALSKALNTAADDLERLVSEITVSAQNLNQAVDEIASGNQNLSQRTSEQASSLEEIASTIEQATAAIRQNAENATRANKLSDETTKLAEEGNAVVTEAVDSINEIAKSSKKIEEIISVINEIAFQTNLLALNAAVEAARAGEQGRGFAVVAGEVRNLAQRSANAAKEIGALIKESVSTIGNGTEKANRSGEALKEIVNSMKNVAQLISEIAAATQEQKQGIDQINIAVTEMDTMTQQNAALVEETASASEEMSGQAKDLRAMMEKFKISESISGGVYDARHREVHLKAASRAVEGARAPKKGNGDGKQASKSDDGNGRPGDKPAGAGVVEKRKDPVEKRAMMAGAGMKDLLKEEGFEEF